MGHFKADCPTLTKPFKKSKKRVKVATWSDNQYSSSNEKEEKTPNLCLTALEDEVTSELNLEFTFGKFHTTFYDLLLKFKKLGLKKNLKQVVDSLTKKKDEVLQRNKILG